LGRHAAAPATAAAVTTAKAAAVTTAETAAIAAAKATTGPTATEAVASAAEPVTATGERVETAVLSKSVALVPAPAATSSIETHNLKRTFDSP